MFNQIYKQPYTIRRHLKAPMLEDRLSYLNHRSEQESSKSVLRKIAQYQLVLIRYLHLEKKSMIALNEIESAAKRWANYETRQFCHKNISYISSKGLFIQHAKDWLHFLGRVASHINPTEFPKLI